jgi:FkbM family methyltransferase
MKSIIQKILSIFDISIKRKSVVDKLLEESIRPKKWLDDIKFVIKFGPLVGPSLADLMVNSKSQINQDIFALYELNFMRNGYFVDFGATDGISLSNSYLLEKQYGFNGILAEPNPNQRKNIKSIRSAAVEKNCVWSQSGLTLSFVDVGDHSTLESISLQDIHAEKRKDKSTFMVETISLTDMLEKHKAPNLIDYLSIDTEGSEFDILASHDFSKYMFKVITVEHNYQPQRDLIYGLLTQHGYVRKFEDISLQDDWYVLKEK